ncbi:MAG TPA: hypothetical protein VFE02_19325 [Candidatus Acidoferrales bacterium]|nr:hypothetical protein [Candidatus Acidoferrales bacterium]
MSEEIRKENSGELTTADLAGVREQKEKTLEMESRATSPTRADARTTDARTAGGAAAGTATARAKAEEDLSPLFSTNETQDFQQHWNDIQVAFVDEPRQAVEDADRLIAQTMKRLAEVFADERQKLEHQWDQGDNVSTEELRVALRRYRSFFSRLLRV